MKSTPIIVMFISLAACTTKVVKKESPVAKETFASSYAVVWCERMEVCSPDDYLLAGSGDMDACIETVTGWMNWMDGEPTCGRSAMKECLSNIASSTCEEDGRNCDGVCLPE